MKNFLIDLTTGVLLALYCAVSAALVVALVWTLYHYVWVIPIILTLGILLAMGHLINKNPETNYRHNDGFKSMAFWRK